MRTPACIAILIVTSSSLGCACSSGTGGRTRSPGSGAATVDAGTLAPSGPSERECDELFAHAIALKVAAQRQTLPADQVPTDAEQAAVRDELRAGFLAECRASSRDSYDCARAATTLDALGACGKASVEPRAETSAYSTRSSSTSNSSVAPGGITPPAPRSP